MRNTIRLSPKCIPKVSKMKRSGIVQELRRLQISFSTQESVMELTKETERLDQF